MSKEVSYYDCFQKIIKPRARFLPEINCSRLFLLNGCPKNEEENKIRAFQILIQEGLLSEDERGNYSVKSPMFPNFFLNPKLEDKELYFTLSLDAYLFRLKFKKQTFELVKHGEYVIPENPSSIDWKIMRLKHFRVDRNNRILENLLKKGFIQLSTKGNFSVVERVGTMRKRRYINFEKFNCKNRYYFTRKSDVKKIVKGYVGDLEIIEH